MYKQIYYKFCFFRVPPWLIYNFHKNLSAGVGSGLYHQELDNI